jgi:hypothetical protein
VENLSSELRARLEAYEAGELQRQSALDIEVCCCFGIFNLPYLQYPLSRWLNKAGQALLSLISAILVSLWLVWSISCLHCHHVTCVTCVSLV